MESQPELIEGVCRRAGLPISGQLGPTKRRICFPIVVVGFIFCNTAWNKATMTYTFQLFGENTTSVHFVNCLVLDQAVH